MSNPTSGGAVAENAVAERLRDAGFEVVRTSVQSTDLRADVVAWAANAKGEVVPWVAVEVKASSRKKPVSAELSLPHLARARDELGTHEHYAVIRGDWFRADRALRSLTPVDGPAAPPYGTKGIVSDQSLVENALRQQWFRLDKDRLRDPEYFWKQWPSNVEHWLAGNMTTPQGESLSIRPDIIWNAGRRVLSALGERRSQYSEFFSHPVVASAVAQLLGDRVAGTVLDPFCGTGSFLWAVGDRVTAEDISRVRLVGGEYNERTASIARYIGQTSGTPVEIRTGNSFELELPIADAIVSAPPIGMRLPEPRVLMNGENTRDSDVAAVDLALEKLQPGGRAVFLLPRSFATRVETYRQFLAEEAWVGALIATPRGSIPGTDVPGLILVFDNSPRTHRTFVAQLGDDDWEAQLTRGSALLEAARRHLDEPYGRGI